MLTEHARSVVFWIAVGMHVLEALYVLVLLVSSGFVCCPDIIVWLIATFIIG